LNESIWKLLPSLPLWMSIPLFVVCLVSYTAAQLPKISRDIEEFLGILPNIKQRWRDLWRESGDTGEKDEGRANARPSGVQETRENEGQGGPKADMSSSSRILFGSLGALIPLILALFFIPDTALTKGAVLSDYCIWYGIYFVVLVVPGALVCLLLPKQQTTSVTCFFAGSTVSLGLQIIIAAYVLYLLNHTEVPWSSWFSRLMFFTQLF
jgi:hypothetical protein